MIARVAVRVELHRLLAIGALQLLIADLARNPKYFVIVCFAHAITNLFSVVRYQR
jgi:hypothetical protein